MLKLGAVGGGQRDVAFGIAEARDEIEKLYR